MISLDYSIIPAIFIFLTLIFILNQLLFKPLMRIQAERGRRTTGLLDKARKTVEHHVDLFNRYQKTIKNARMEGYRRQEQVRAEAMKKRAEALAKARGRAEVLIQESRETIRHQVEAAKAQLGPDALEIARGITASILQREA